MRLCSILAASCLTGLLMAQSPASAEPASGWVDPPAKEALTPSARYPHRSTEKSQRPMAAPSEISTVPDPRFTDRAAQAQRLAGDYLDSVSSRNDAMLTSAPRFYGERVLFHGRTMSLAALMAEKRRFVRRWPERRYRLQEGATRTACDAARASCVVRTLFGFQAGSPARGARSQGLSELTLTVSFAGERPVIVSETSRVLRRGSLALGPAERRGGA
ncbi:hypothetical protein GCM10007884_15400 [Methylobacterium brachythecii]|nr:hypothetical protein GCM10007884_15400 [Methylobacterium brachythecii]